jgi:hypothetical protein
MSRPTARRLLACWPWLVLIALIAVLFASPVEDGDLFWHMAYARQMLARGALVLDHQAFSWTPAATSLMYCAWLSELALYGLWTHVGAWSVFALRYAAIGLVVVLAWRFAKTTGLSRGPILPALVALVLIASRPGTGTMIKPELFSFVFTHVALYWLFRAKVRRLDEERVRSPLVPIALLTLVWVNTHGAFILVAPFAALVVIGEAIDWRVAPRLALVRSPRELAGLAAGAIACLAAMAITPYGWRYPAQVVMGVPDAPPVYFEWNAAHLRPFEPTAAPLHLAEYAVLLAGLVVFASVHLWRHGGPGRRIDVTVLLLNAAAAVLYVGQVRTVYFWPAVALWSVPFLLRAGAVTADDVRSWLSARTGEAVAGLAIGAYLLFALRAGYEARYHPWDRAWLGFGVSDLNPVAEAEFLDAARIGPRLYNSFNAGGYLIWRLHPSYLVMSDQRAFPYVSWFEELVAFTTGRTFDAFIDAHPADAAVIDLAMTRAVDRFVTAPAWRLAYYGPSAAVFVRTTVDVPDAATRIAPRRFDDVRSPSTALRLFYFAIEVGDYPTVWRVFDQLTTRHRHSLSAAALDAAVGYRDGHRLVARGDYAGAIHAFARVDFGPVRNAHDTAILTRLREWRDAEGPARAAIEQELQTLAVRE